MTYIYVGTRSSTHEEDWCLHKPLLGRAPIGSHACIQTYSSTVWWEAHMVNKIQTLNCIPFTRQVWCSQCGYSFSRSYCKWLMEVRGPMDTIFNEFWIKEDHFTELWFKVQTWDLTHIHNVYQEKTIWEFCFIPFFNHSVWLCENWARCHKNDFLSWLLWWKEHNMSSHLVYHSPL